MADEDIYDIPAYSQSAQVFKCSDENITLLEQYLFTEDKQSFLKKLIQGTDEYQYFKFLDLIQQNGGDLDEETAKNISKYRKMKSEQSKSIYIRYLLGKYEKTTDDEEKKKILKDLNKHLFKIKFLHDYGDKKGSAGLDLDLNQNQDVNQQSEHQIFIRNQSRSQSQSRGASRTSSMSEGGFNLPLSPQQSSQEIVQQQQYVMPQQIFDVPPNQFQQYQIQPQYQVQQQQDVSYFNQVNMVPQQQALFNPMQQVPVNPLDINFYGQQQQIQVQPQIYQYQENDLILPNLQVLQQVQQPLQNYYVADGELSEDEQVLEKPDNKELTSVLNQNLIRSARHLKLAATRLDFLNQIKKEYYGKISVNRILKKCKDLNVVLTYLQGVQFDLLENAQLAALIDHYIRLSRQKNSFYSFDQWTLLAKMSYEQLLHLGTGLKEQPQLWKVGTYGLHLFKKRFSVDPLTEELELSYQDEQTVKSRLARYKQHLEWVGATLNDPVYAILKDALLQEILCYGLLNNIYDFDSFVLFLKDPREYSDNFNNRQKQNYNTQQTNLRKISNLISESDLSFLKGRYGQISREEIYTIFITQYFKLHPEKSQQIFSDYFTEQYLQKLKILAILESGGNESQGELGNIHKHFSIEEIQQMNKEKLLKLQGYNKKYFEVGEPVSLAVKLKNIQQLKVKVFEFVAENYYLTNKSKLNEHIDLDGLTAQEEINFDFSKDYQGVCQTLVREFQLESLSQPGRCGLYIVEFFGSGIASRAVIQKGRLQAVQRSTVAGACLRLINQSGEIQKSERTGVWLDDQFYRADADGEIIIPLGKTFSGTAVLVSGGFADIQTLSFSRETYALSAQLVYNEQSFIPGNQARIIFNPVLRMSGEVVPLSILDALRIQVRTLTVESIPALYKQDYAKNLLTYEGEFEVQFHVPNKINKIEVELSGKVLYSGEAERREVKFTREIHFESFEGMNNYSQFYLQRAPRSGDYVLRVLGKNGEPIRKVEVALMVTHRQLREPFHLTRLVTDADGNIRLGALQDVVSVQVYQNATQSVGATSDLTLNGKTFVLENRIYSQLYQEFQDTELCAGETFRISHVAGLERSEFSLIQVDERLGTVLAFWGSRLSLEGDVLSVSDLPAGTYLLSVREFQKVVRLTVLVRSARRWLGTPSVLLRSQLLDCPESARKALPPYSIESLSVEEGRVRVRLAFPDADSARLLRVHALGLQFLPEFGLQQGQPTAYSRSATAISLKKENNIYMSNRQLGDEFAYVLNRKEETRFIGNNLEKPGILLRRQFVRNTEEARAQVRRDCSYERAPENDDLFGGALDNSYSEDEAGRCFSPRGGKGFTQTSSVGHKKKQRMPASSTSSARANFFPGASQPIDQWIHSSLSGVVSNQKISKLQFFLQNPAPVWQNLRPDENSVLTIDYSAHKNLSAIQLFFSTPYHRSIQFISLTPSVTQGMDIEGEKVSVEIKDQRHRPNLNKDKFYSILRNSVLVNSAQEFLNNDPGSTQISFVENVSKHFELLKQLCIYEQDWNRGTLEKLKEWEFLTTWNRASESEKLKNLSKFISHELNLFVYLKDREFFDKHVRGHLENKIEKELVDLFLLERWEDLLRTYNQVETLNSLSPLEFCLLILALKNSPGGRDEEAASFVGVLESQFKLQVIDIQKWKRLFDVVLNQTDKPQIEVNTIAQPLGGGGSYPPPPMYSKFQAPIQQLNPFSANVGWQVQAPQQVIQQAMYQNSMPQQAMYQHSMPQQVALRHRNLFAQYDASSDSESASDCEQELMEEDVPMPKGARIGSKLRRRSVSRGRGQVTEGGRFEPLADKYTQLRTLQQQNRNLDLESTKEYQETQYFDKDGSIELNQFWLDLARHVCATGSLRNFVSQNFVYARTSLREALLSLGVLGLEFEAPKIQQTQRADNKQVIRAEGNVFVFCKEIKEGQKQIKDDIIISQRFYDPSDRYQYDENDPTIYFEKEVTEFITNKIYGCKIVIINSNIAQQQLQLLYEIPEGAIPVQQLQYTKSQLVSIGEYSSQIREFMFYFPAPGRFTIYPANASKDGQVYALAKARDFEVLEERKTVQQDSIKQLLLSKGSKEDILAFMETKNILNQKIFNFDQIYHLLDDRDFFLRLVAILKRRKIYDPVVFSYSIFHNHPETIQDFLNSPEMKEHIYQHLKFVESSLVKIPQNLGQTYLKILDFYPLVNNRVHLLRRDMVNIQNQQFREQYHKFLLYIVEKGTQRLQPEDKLVLVYYLLLQERIREAMDVFRQIEERSVESARIQYDYISAYLDIYFGYPNFQKARSIIENYLDYPVVSWRNLFYEMANQIAEYDGEELIEDEQNAGEQGKEGGTASSGAGGSGQEKTEREQVLELSISGKDVVVEHKNVESTEEVHVSYYVIDLEVFFSKKPFLSKLQDDFSYLIPAQKVRITLQDQKGLSVSTSRFAVPEQLANQNLYVQVNSSKKRTGAIYFSTNLKVALFETQGVLKVTDESGKLLSKTYVKVFAKRPSGEIDFYKDGYTDMRGKFDYLQMQSEGTQNYEKFSMIIINDELGSLIKEVKAPKKSKK